MPFTKIKGSTKYKSPSGKTYTKQQVMAYHVTNGWKKKTK